MEEKTKLHKADVGGSTTSMYGNPNKRDDLKNKK